MDRTEKLARAIKEGENIGPKTVMISPTDKCNLKCKTCWRMDKNQDEFERGLSLEKIREILEDCNDLDVDRIDFTGGGEPFLRKEIFEMIEIAKSFDFEVSLTTNGMFLDENKIKELKELGLDEILFSLDGLKETNDYIRGYGVFENVIDTMEKYRKINGDVILGLSTVIMNKNIDELEDLIKLTDELNLDYHNFTVLNVWNSNEYLSLDKKNKDSIYKKLEEAKNVVDQTNVESNLGKIIEYGIFEREPPKFCFAPWNMVFINASGEVMACCTLASYYKNLLGNVKEDSLQSIWNGEKLEEFREELKRGNFHDKCKECLPVFIDEFNKTYENLRSKYEF